MNKRAKVFYANQLAGIINQTPDGYQFAYDKDYLKLTNAKPISATLPLTDAAYFSRILFACFDGLISEGWLLNVALKQWTLKEQDRFELLLQACEDTIGAVSVVADHSI